MTKLKWAYAIASAIVGFFGIVTLLFNHTPDRVEWLVLSFGGFGISTMLYNFEWMFEDFERIKAMLKP